MNKKIIIGIGGLILAVFIGYFIYQNLPATVEKKESDFSFKNVEKIEKFYLSNQKGQKIEISKNNQGEWLLNKTYPASDEALALVFDALKSIETQGPTPQAAADYVLKDMLQSHFRIEIFDGGKEPAKTFYIGGPTLNNEGTYMLMEVDGKMAQRSYITYIPGLKAYLTSRFDPDTIRWRSRWVFPYPIDEIQSLSVNYLGNKDNSFLIEKVSSDSFTIATLSGDKTNQPKQTFIQQYLNFYNSISIEAFQNTKPIKDTILAQVPYCIVSLKTTTGKTQKATLYYKPISDASRVLFDEQNVPLKYDIEYYYITYNEDKDFAIVQYYVWSKVLRNYKEFFGKPTAAN